LGGDAGLKPWNWSDADNTPAFNATIRTNANAQSANVTRVNGDTWGKVRTFAISCTNAHKNIRVLVPSHSASVSWKLAIQEEGGAWRNWVVQESTGATGYLEYDFGAILTQVNSGSGSFSIEVIVEGAVGQYIELGELYVYDGTGVSYWRETFANGVIGSGGTHTAGWFDATTNPDFHGTITNVAKNRGLITRHTNWSKVMSPVLKWDAAACKSINVELTGYDNTKSYSPPLNTAFNIVIQEQGGAYRQWAIPPQWHVEWGGHGITWSHTWYTGDLTAITELANGTPFSVAIILDGENPFTPVTLAVNTMWISDWKYGNGY
jgi:hypothetical protein